MSPVLAGGLLSTVPPGKSHNAVLTPADLGSRVNTIPQVWCRRKIQGNVCVMRNGEEQRALNLLREYSIFFFFFFTIQEEIFWAEPIPVEARRLKGKEASGTKFSPKLVEIK